MQPHMHVSFHGMRSLRVTTEGWPSSLLFRLRDVGYQCIKLLEESLVYCGLEYWQELTNHWCEEID